jgi:hypothetical protein
MLALWLDAIAPPAAPAELFANELVVRVSGPLSTRIAPPLPFEAALPEKLDVLTLYELIPPLKLYRSSPPPPPANELAVLLLNVEPLIMSEPVEGILPIGSPAE